MHPIFVLGTRPEVIKLFPVIREFKNPEIIFTSQQPYYFCLPFFEELDIKPQIQTLCSFETTSHVYKIAKILENLDVCFKQKNNCLVVVEGDTSSALAAAQAAFHNRAPVAHVEAGMRSGNKYAPFPEEMNRILISQLAEYHFCPTRRQQENLEAEGVKRNIFVTGNTVVDALLYMKKKRQKPCNEVLITLHRREIFGKPLAAILTAINNVAKEFLETRFIFSLHSNPNSSEQAEILLSGNNIFFARNMEYSKFLDLIDGARLIISDSGGILEEAAVLNKPFLILRNETERPEVLKVGTLVGTNPAAIKKAVRKILSSASPDPVQKFNLDIIGDGNAGNRIANIIKGV